MYIIHSGKWMYMHFMFKCYSLNTLEGRKKNGVTITESGRAPEIKKETPNFTFSDIKLGVNLINH